MKDIIVSTSKLTKKYGNVIALNKVDITIKRGEIYGLVGNNGAGKTTLFKLLSGQTFASSGDFSLFGQEEPRQLEKQRNRLGMLIEDPGFYPNLSVETNLEYCRLQRGIPHSESVTRILKRVNLYDARKKPCKSLSMGMKQRYGLAVALLGEPELLVLDEPINGLDPSGIIEIRQLLKGLNEEKNITILLSSHILSEMEQLATRYGFLNRGKLVRELSAQELESTCSDYIEILVSDPERYIVLLEQNLGSIAYRVMPDRSLRILEAQQPVEVFSQLASKYSLDIYRLNKKKLTLEEYYMDLNKEDSSHD